MNDNAMAARALYRIGHAAAGIAHEVLDEL
jgi:hypothetical protein